MTREEKQKAIDALKISAPVIAVTQEEFNDYIQTLNKIMDWLEQEPTAKNDFGVDCISRSRAIERLELNFPISAGADNSRDRHRYMQALADIQAIRELPSVTPQEPRWIPVSERLPEEDGGYLVTVKQGYVRTSLWVGNAEYWNEVTAWMPLPKPYREVEE